MVVAIGQYKIVKVERIEVWMVLANFKIRIYIEVFFFFYLNTSHV